MALQNGVMAFLLQDPFYPVQISHFTTTKAPPVSRPLLVEEGEDQRAAWYVFIMLIFNESNWTLKYKNDNQTVLSDEDTQQKTITHNSRVKTGYLSMVLNQGQRLTAASDWEPDQGKSEKTDHRLPTPTHALTILKQRQNTGTKVRTWHILLGPCRKSDSMTSPKHSHLK